MVWSWLSLTFHHSKIFETSALHHARLWQVDWIFQTFSFDVCVIQYICPQSFRHLKCRAPLSKRFNQTDAKRATPCKSLRSNCDSYLVITIIFILHWNSVTCYFICFSIKICDRSGTLERGLIAIRRIFKRTYVWSFLPLFSKLRNPCAT